MNITKALRTVAKDWGYPLLLLAVGVVLIRESQRLTAKYQPADWLSGPSGFMMIVGGLLLFLMLLECGKMILGKARAARVRIEAAPTAQAGQGEGAGTAEKRYQKRALLTLGLLCLYALLIKPLGFVLASSLYLGANLYLLQNTWKVTLITVAVIFACLLWLAPFIGLSLPRGLLGF